MVSLDPEMHNKGKSSKKQKEACHEQCSSALEQLGSLTDLLVSNRCFFFSLNKVEEKKKTFFVFCTDVYKKRNECRRCVFQRTFSPRLLSSVSLRRRLTDTALALYLPNEESGDEEFICIYTMFWRNTSL